jgi:hypothetical protein
MYEMRTFYAQGDLLFEQVDDFEPMPEHRLPLVDGVIVLAEGEQTGHRHAVGTGAVMFRDDGLARDIPDGLYLAHLRVSQAGATVVHDEHAPLKLQPGTYRVRRQRELQPQDVALVAD